MASDFRIEIPFDMKGGKSGGDAEMKKLNENVKNLDKTMYGTVDIIEMLSSILGDVFKLISPLFKLLSLLLMVFFIPLLPLIKLIVEGISKMIKWLFDSGAIEGMMAVFKLLADFIGWIVGLLIKGLHALLYVVVWAGVMLYEGLKWLWDEVLKPVFLALWEGIKWVWEKLLKPVFEFMCKGLKGVWEALKLAWQFLIGAGKWIWENIILPAWNFLKDVGLWIWERILKPAWNYLKNVGEWVWDIVSSPFRWLADKIKGIWNWFKKEKSESKTSSVNDAIIRPNGDIIRTNPLDYLIATKDPKGLMSQGVVININHPSVREERDIKKIAEETSKILERKLWRSY